jgi:hypothetical protein
MTMRFEIRGRQLALTLAWTVMLAYFFAHAEIQIEGGAGWAANLPTWRIEQHWLLDVFWGGRPMTGYHAWVFPFIAMFFHLPLFFMGHWSWRAECLVLACIMLFWIVEDFLWFMLNPAFGLARFHAEAIPWHKHWVWVAPADYWIFASATMILLWISLRKNR